MAIFHIQTTRVHYMSSWLGIEHCPRNSSKLQSSVRRSFLRCVPTFSVLGTCFFSKINHGYFIELWGKHPHPGCFGWRNNHHITIWLRERDPTINTLLTSINRWPKLWYLPVRTICNIDAGPLLRPKKRHKTTNHKKSRDRIVFLFHRQCRKKTMNQLP